MRDTANMSLRVWDELNDYFSHAELAENWDTIDAHDHTGGVKGLQIPKGGLAFASVENTNLEDNAVTTSKVANAAVTEDKLALQSVSTGRIKNEAVTPGQLATNAVTTPKINDLAVTTPKLADNAVTLAKIAQAARGVSLIQAGELVGSATATWTAPYAGNYLVVCSPSAFSNISVPGDSALEGVHVVINGSIAGSSNLFVNQSNTPQGKHLVFPVIVVSVSVAAGSQTIGVANGNLTGVDGNDRSRYAILEAR